MAISPAGVRVIGEAEPGRAFVTRESRWRMEPAANRAAG